MTTATIAGQPQQLLAAADWPAISADLDASGCAVTPGLLTPAEHGTGYRGGEFLFVEQRPRAQSAARLRRIERDLHDGAQVRLAALAMTLGEIKENLERSAGDDHTLDLVGAAHQNAKDTLAELRDLARGIHPPVLDRGLCPAVGILAGTSAIPVALTVAVTERPSPAIEAIELFAAAPAGVGYLLKDRVADVSDFIDAITRVAHGGTVLDPEVVRQLLTASRRGDTLAALTPREREVLSLVAQGRSNAAIAAALFISPKVVEKHVANIFDKLDLAPDNNDNRRVIATLRYLES